MNLPAQPASRHGIVLFAHGARDPAWATPFERVRQHLASTHGQQGPVALAFLEFMSPSLLEAGRQMVDHHCTQVTVVPLFLGAGGHVRKDLPGLIHQLRQDYPDVQWQLTAAVGESPLVIAAMSEAALQMAEASTTGSPSH